MKAKLFLNTLVGLALLVGIAVPQAQAEMDSVSAARLGRAQTAAVQLNLDASQNSEGFLYPQPYPPYPPPQPYPPQPYPSYPRPYPGPRDLCSGAYSGTFSNGVQGVLFINGYGASMNVNGVVFSGSFDCQEDGDGDRAEIYYELSNPSFPGPAQGQGSIVLTGDGRTYLQATQNNGLTFNAVR